MKEQILTNEEIRKMNMYFNALNYLSVGQLYLLDNPLLRRPLDYKDVKPNLVGHWGTAPGQNFIYMHLNRVIKEHNLNMLYVSGPGHGGEAMVANVYLEGTYSEVYPNITEDEEGLKHLFKQFSFPGGISSHVAPETPGSINEGGELGYSLSHAFGAVLDNPDLMVACVVGDGEAETGPLATSWHGNKLINPKTDGAVLPILHLNGYKIANPTIFARIPHEELINYFLGCGYEPLYVEGDDVSLMQELMAEAMEKAITSIKKIQREARENNSNERPRWPMIIFRTPKGWTGPKVIDGKQFEGSFRSHQIPFVVNKNNPGSLEMLEQWLKSYHPEELFDEKGRLIPELKELLPEGNLRMGSNLHANGGVLLRELRIPNFKEYGVKFDKPGSIMAQDMMELGKYVRDVIKLNPNNFRIFGPDEALSNRLNYAFEETNRQWNATMIPSDEYLSKEGRIIDSYLSEHMCEGMLEGYLLTGRHGFIHSYEAFVRIIDSMASQHAKWLKVTSELPWRRPIASLNFILASHVWQQDHNGFTHQDPGFINHLVTKKADITRVYLPPDANCLISCFDHCIKSKNYINVIIASKHPRPQWLSMEEAVKHCTEGIGIWQFASNDEGTEPDIVYGCAGETPTLEVLAAVDILHKNLPDVKVRVVNVVDLMKLQSKENHPHGLSNTDYNSLFTKDKPIVFVYHGYPNLIHELTYNRVNKNLHVRGYNEEGTITTPFDMRVQNHIDRYHLVMDAIKYLPQYGDKTAYLYQYCKDQLVKHKEYIREYGQDIEEVRNWKWGE